jgi:hypothetical protein
VFEYGDRVDVMSGLHIGDYGTVVEGPIDLRPSHVRVELERAGHQLYMPVRKLELRTDDQGETPQCRWTA